MSGPTKPRGLLGNARSPGSIFNAEHHDPTASQRSIDGVPLTIDSVVADSTVSTPVSNQAVIRVFNTDAAVQYIWIGEEGSEPGSIDITTGIALAPGQPEMIFSGISTDCKKSLVIKSSSATVQVVIMRS